MIGLGDYPAVRLSETRERSEAARKLVKDGVNPAQQRQLDRVRQANEATNTFDVIAKEWLQTKDWEDITKNRRLDMLERVVFPNIGKLPVREITSAQILNIPQSTFKRGAPSVAAEARRTMSAVFKYAVATLRVDSDPVWPVRKALPTNRTQQKTALTTDQIGKLLRNFDNHRCTFPLNYCIQLMWWTLERPSEVAEAERDEFDIEAAIGRVPSRRMKPRKEHIVPLPRQAIQMLNVLHGITGNRTHLFPGRDNRQMPMAVASMRQALKVLGWSGNYSPMVHGRLAAHGQTSSDTAQMPSKRSLLTLIRTTCVEPITMRHSSTSDASMMQDWADLLDVWRRE